MLEKAYWLDEEEKIVIEGVLQAPYLQLLTFYQKEKLKALLCSLLYAERASKRKLTEFCEKLLNFFSLTPFFCKTLGIWGLHVRHAERFHFSPRTFKKVLFDKTIATKIVIRHILEDILLVKEPKLIFAEYNLRPQATTVAAFQRLINFLHGKKVIFEDGILGPKTYAAFKKYASCFPPFFSYETINEEMMLKTIQFFNSKYFINIQPFVPEVRIKKDAHLFFKIIRNPKRWKEIGKLFANHIDVIRYAEMALEAYEKLHTYPDPLS